MDGQQQPRKSYLSFILPEELYHSFAKIADEKFNAKCYGGRVVDTI